jgi:transposase-like protein
VTDAVPDDVREWQARPLVLEGPRRRPRPQQGLLRRVRRQLEGERDVLGLSSQSSEGAKFGKTIKTRGHFPTEEAARKLILPPRSSALRRSWRRTYNWSAALLSFKIHFGDQLP